MQPAFPTLAEMIRALIETPSVSSELPEHDMPNEAVVAHLAGWLEDLGFAVELLPVPEKPGKLNLIARRGSGPDGLVLAGHTDTVPCDENLWQHDPFRLTEADGRLYGLGTSDMKAFLAIAVEAARRARDANLRRPLVILATADEESSMHGAKALVAAGTRLGRQAVIGEPTGLRPVRMHKGILMEGIHVIGRSGHSSNPALGANAIEGLHAVISALVAWRETLARRYRNDAFEVPYPTLNLGHVHGGDNANRICGDCQLHVDLRSLPGMDTNELREELREQVRAALAGTPFRLDFEPLFDGIPALETPAATAIVAAAEALTGEPAGAVAFGTEGPYFRRLGLDTLILGPGDIDLAHQPDEYLDASRIAPTLDLLGRLIERFCGEPVADA